MVGFQIPTLNGFLPSSMSRRCVLGDDDTLAQLGIQIDFVFASCEQGPFDGRAGFLAVLRTEHFGPVFILQKFEYRLLKVRASLATLLDSARFSASSRNKNKLRFRFLLKIFANLVL